jgi:hypothetical protein
MHARNGLMLTEYDASAWEADYVYLYGTPIARVWAENRVKDIHTITEWDISWYHLDRLAGQWQWSSFNWYEGEKDVPLIIDTMDGGMSV